jgi:retron-type reverse transcriptase
MYGLSAPASDTNSVFSYREIYQRYLECRKNKRNTDNALKFEINAEENILELEKQLRERTYRPSRSILFVANKPKMREIFAADFRDRVVHHILVYNLTKIWDPVFIHDSYACRIGKGTHAAVVRLRSFLRRITKNGNIRAYYLQLDVKDFFTSINKEILFDLLKKHCDNSDILWLLEVVIFWDCTRSYICKGTRIALSQIPDNKSLFGKENKRGLPIGNYTSQFFANVYLNCLDQFVKHQLRAKHYLRYVDDFVILSTDKDELIRFRNEIDRFLQSRLNLKLHPKRRKLLTASSGIDFLGYIIRHDYILVRRRVINNLKQKLRNFQRSKTKDFKKLNAVLESYFGHFKVANSFKLKTKFLKETDMLCEIL